MARLLVKNNRLAVRNGRLVSTANGAPCCCGPSGPCPCDPTAEIQRPTYLSCEGGTQGEPARLFMPPFRRLIIRASYSTASSETFIQTGSVNNQSFAEEKGLTGQAVLCISGALGIVSITGQSTWYNRRTGSSGSIFDLQNVEEGTNVFAIGAPSTRPGVPYEYQGAGIGWPLGPLNGRIITPNFTQRYGLTRFGGAGRCVQTIDINQPDPQNGGGTIVRGDARFSDSPTGGQATATYFELQDTRFPPSPFRAVSTKDQRSQFTWTYELDLCEGGGGGDSGDRPGGCNGCGDPSRLTII
jgi:hypothetical protein